MARSHRLDLAADIRAAAARQVIASRDIAELLALALELLVDPPPQPSGGRELTAEEVAEQLGVRARTVRRWANEGLIPVSRFGSGSKARLRFTFEDVERFRKERQR